ncbi:autotransporter-associated beta strand repeat-containing protein [Haloferula sp. BvORR071]|uniref:beta strand repeat-containing protein n=1 Tax=Haloferula sp. BvORR071 TaxID=1396141 RepID=UPI000557F3B2|nr:autotransporter-associated beta strand repeat-containing protein [Haloferula sp. BvORR071]
MKPSRNPFLVVALATSATVSLSSAIDKAATGTELTDGTSWAGGVAPATANPANWTSTSLTGGQTVSGPVTWNQIGFANTTALSLTGSAITLSGATSNGSFNVINDTGATGTRSIGNDLLLSGVNSTTAVAVGNLTSRLQINAGTGGLTLGNVTSNGGALANDANLFLRGTAGSSIINGTLTVDGQLGKGDAGTWTLNGNNSLGWVFINNGTLRAGNDGAFGSGTIYLGTGGGTTTLSSADGTARNFGNGLNFSIGATFGQTSGGTGALTFTGGVNLNTAQRAITTNVDTIFSGVVTGTGGGIAKDGAATLTLSNANTHSGVTAVNAGTLALGNDGALGTSQLRMGGGTIASADSTARVITTNRQLDFANSSTFGTASTGNLKFVDTVSLGNAADKIATVNNTVTEFAGVISDGGDTTRKFTKAGTGNLIISGNNTYSRQTTVTSGTLTAGHASAFGTGTITINGGVLNTGAYAVGNTITLAGGTLTGTAATSTVTVTGSSSISGIFSGMVNTGTDPARAINTTGGLTVGTLTGQGAFGGGLVTVNGQHNPGNSPGSQSFANGLSYGNNANVTTEIAADGSAADQISITGDLGIGNNVALAVTLFGAADYTTAFWDSNHSFDLFTYTGALNGAFSSINLSGLDNTAGQGSWSTSSGGGKVTATWTAVPEPSMALLGGLGLLALLRRRR